MDPDNSLRAAYQLRPMKAPPGEHPSPETLQALVRAEGRLADRLVLLDHVMACPRCRPEFELVRSIHAAARRDIALGTPNRIRLWIPIAAIVTLMIGATFLWQRRVGRSEQPVYRDAPNGVGITLQVPLEGGELGEDRQFTWQGAPGASYRFELLDAAGTVAYDRELADTTVALPASVKLRPGVYSWLVVARLPTGEARTARPRGVIVR
ncbi:MAG: hypothetical protein ABI647_09215 [Gemmatimonadota bacterium]